MRYRLRTLLILLAVLPPVMAIVAPRLAQWFVTEPQLVRAVSNSRPELKSYYLHFIDPVFAHKAVRAKLASRPNVWIAPDRRIGAIHVRAQPDDHAAIEAILSALDRASPPARPATLADR